VVNLGPQQYQIQVLVLMIGAFSVSLSLSKLVCWIFWQRMLPLFGGHLWGELAGVFESCFPWSGETSGTCGISKVVSPDGCLVSIRWFFLPTRRLKLRSVFAHHLIVQYGQICFCFCQVAAMLFPQPQHLLVISSPNKVGQFSVVPHAQFYKMSSAICYAPDLGGWLLLAPLLSEFSSSSHPHSQSLDPRPTPAL
jgi:hypothetical protein